MVLRSPHLAALLLLVAACQGDKGVPSGTEPFDCRPDEPGLQVSSPEICNGVDDDCDEEIDGPTAQGALIGFTDADGDGYGDPDSPIRACEGAAAFSLVAGDCDDSDPSVHPAAQEICDLRDDDCDGRVDDGVEERWAADTDGDGYGDDSTSSPCLEEGWLELCTDCDDSTDTTHPDQPDLCNQRDDDCDGERDEDSSDHQPWYVDFDRDGYGQGHVILEVCPKPADALSMVTGDCDDHHATISPAAAEDCWTEGDEDCDGLDGEEDPDCAAAERCEGGVDEDADGLVDCEDGDCFGRVPCTEDCSSNEDLDGDGLAGCQDDDCQAAPGCRLTVAHLTGGSARRVWDTSWFGFEDCDTGTTQWGTRVERRIEVYDLVGTLQVQTAAASAWQDCSFAVDEVRIEVPERFDVVRGSSSFSTAWAGRLHREGFAIDPGCPVQTSGFLPEMVSFYGRVVPDWGGSLSPVGVEPWYQGQLSISSYDWGSPRTSTCYWGGAFDGSRREDTSYRRYALGSGSTVYSMGGAP